MQRHFTIDSITYTIKKENDGIQIYAERDDRIYKGILSPGTWVIGNVNLLKYETVIKCFERRLGSSVKLEHTGKVIEGVLHIKVTNSTQVNLKLRLVLVDPTIEKIEEISTANTIKVLEQIRCVTRKNDDLFSFMVIVCVLCIVIPIFCSVVVIHYI